MRNNIDSARLDDVLIVQGLRLGTLEFVPADQYVVTADHPPVLIMSPAGAVSIRMPVSGPDTKGLAFLLINPSAAAITLVTSTGAALTTAVILAAGESAWVICTGSATPALGWRGTATAPST